MLLSSVVANRKEVLIMTTISTAKMILIKIIRELAAMP
jgi:hypothetical protein